MDSLRNLTVEISVGAKKVTITSDEGDLANISPEFFCESPREAIAFADLVAQLGFMVDLVKAVRDNSDVVTEDVRSLASMIVLPGEGFVNV